jgi:putative Ca2+/H+ antiporter (TMEM165/GDT1 family)
VDFVAFLFAIGLTIGVTIASGLAVGAGLILMSSLEARTARRGGPRKSVDKALKGS